MSRKEKSREVRNKILDVARELMLAQGYKVTTIRQIIEEAGVQTGTLYHFFRDKEDILLQLVIDAYNQIMRTAATYYGKEKDPAMQYALIYALEMKAVHKYKRVAELYLEAYSSWRITTFMMPFNLERNKAFFHRYNKDFTEQDYYLRTLSLRGMRLSFLTEQAHTGTLGFETTCQFLIRTGLSMFNVPPTKIDSTIKKTMQMVKKDMNLTVYGLSI